MEKDVLAAVPPASSFTAYFAFLRLIPLHVETFWSCLIFFAVIISDFVANAVIMLSDLWEIYRERGVARS